jgi:DNA-binding NarL/FixJ family response regulator
MRTKAKILFLNEESTANPAIDGIWDQLSLVYEVEHIFNWSQANEAVRMADYEGLAINFKDHFIDDARQIEALLKIDPSLKIMLFVSGIENFMVRQFLDSGVKGFLSKYCHDGLDIKNGIAAVLKGKNYISKELINLSMDEQYHRR